jgi:hypothetical protein
VKTGIPVRTGSRYDEEADDDVDGWLSRTRV